MYLLSPEAKKRLCDHFGVDEQTALIMLTSEEEYIKEKNQYIRSKADRKVLKDANFSKFMSFTETTQKTSKFEDPEVDEQFKALQD